MLGRQKNSPGGATKLTDQQPVAAPAPHEVRPGAKNRPTPKRKDAQAARRQPLVPADRKAAKEADKQKAREQRVHLRDAAERGDDSALPKRDRGPEKRYIRDRVDARRSFGEVAMPLLLIAVVFTVLPGAALKFISFLVIWLVALVGFIDAFLLWRRVRSGLLTKFGKIPPGAARYTIMRAFQIRRGRFPRPVVQRGDVVD